MSNDPFDAALIETSLRSMLASGHFNICTIDSILKVTCTKPPADVYNRLRLLHCIDYALMPREVIEALPGLIRDVLGGPALDVEALFRPRRAARDNVIDITPEPRRAGLLAFWRKP